MNRLEGAKERLIHAERCWQRLFSEEFGGETTLKAIALAIETLNLAEHLYLHELSIEREERIRRIEIDWTSPENKDIEEKRLTMLQIVQGLLKGKK